MHGRKNIIIFYNIFIKLRCYIYLPTKPSKLLLGYFRITRKIYLTYLYVVLVLLLLGSVTLFLQSYFVSLYEINPLMMHIKVQRRSNITLIYLYEENMLTDFISGVNIGQLNF